MADRTYELHLATKDAIREKCYQGTSNHITISETPVQLIINDWDDISTLDQIAINSWLTALGYAVVS